MSTYEQVVLSPSSQANASADSVALVATPSTSWLQQAGLEQSSAMRLQSPSTLTLALIGAGTLLAYRAIHERLKAAVPSRVRPRVQPRKRRAA